MKNIELARASLEGHSIALCRDGELLTSDKRGIAPMIDFIAEGKDLRGYSAADLVVGKAAAMLFVKAGIKEVYAQTLSTGGKEYLESHGINVTFSELTGHIRNRAGTGICPMEETVSDISAPEEGYAALAAKLALLRKK